MTFEEFFIKKKIDLGLLKSRQPALYNEFQLHFGLMGEKSFDHTKKYWFNRLRKDFLLHDAPVSIPPKAETLSSKPAASAMDTSVSSPAAKPAGFKPRFKAGMATPKSQAAEEGLPKPAEEAAETDNPPAETPPAASKPVGFKPRFKAGMTTPKSPAAEEEVTKPAEEAAETDNPPAETPPAASKPVGFKPRFKAGITNAKKDPPAENGG